MTKKEAYMKGYEAALMDCIQEIRTSVLYDDSSDDCGMLTIVRNGEVSYYASLSPKSTDAKIQLLNRYVKDMMIVGIEANKQKK